MPFFRNNYPFSSVKKNVISEKWVKKSIFLKKKTEQTLNFINQLKHLYLKGKNEIFLKFLISFFSLLFYVVVFRPHMINTKKSHSISSVKIFHPYLTMEGKSFTQSEHFCDDFANC